MELRVTDMRIGQGYDIHRTDPGRPLWLGGVRLEEGPGLEGHSDADVLLHALMDALLGATGSPDIGVLFPNTDPGLKGISSLELLKRVMEHLSQWQIINVDLTLIAEAPKISPYRNAIRKSVAEALGIALDCVGLKATTAERLGDLGKGLGMEAFAVALLHRK